MQAKALLGATLAAAMFIATGSAHAAASGQLTLDGAPITQTVSGVNWESESFHTVLGSFASQTFSIDYDYRLAAQGLPALRTWDYCLPVFAGYCGPAETGNELAEASIQFIAEGRYGYNYDIDYAISDGSLIVDDTDGVRSAHGTITITATNVDEFGSEPADFSILAALWIDASPLSVPEPSGAVLLLAGLLPLLARRPRRGA